MSSKLFWFSLFLAIPAALLMARFEVQANAADSEEISHIQSGHTTAKGVVTELKSGLYTVKTSTGTTYTLAESVAARDGHEAPKIGDEMVLWINEGNMVIDAHKKGASDKDPSFMSGRLISINYGRSQMTVSISGGEKSFRLRPESRMFTDMAVGTPIIIVVNGMGEVIDVHVDSKSDVPHSGLNSSQNNSALKDFRHLGVPE